MPMKIIGAAKGVKVKNPYKHGSLLLSPEEWQRISGLITNTLIERVPVVALTKNPRNAKRHPEEQLLLLAEGIRTFGFTVPIIVDETNKIIAGHK